MSPRRQKRKDNGGFRSIAHRAVTALGNAAKKEARVVPGRPHARTESVPPSSTPNIADASTTQVPAGGTVPPSSPPAKRLRFHMQPQQERRQELQRQERKKPQAAPDMENCVTSSPVKSTVSGCCSNQPCSSQPHYNATTAQPPLACLQENACSSCKDTSGRASATLIGEAKGSPGEQAVSVSALYQIPGPALTTPTRSTDSIRWSLRASRVEHPPLCAMARASATSTILADAANSVAASLVSCPQRKDQDDLLSPAADVVSPTKKILLLAEPGNENYFSVAEDQAVGNNNESDANNEPVEKDAPTLKNGRSLKPARLQTRHSDTAQPSTPTPRLLLKQCCSTGVRTPPSGSPLSMSSQASTNSAFSGSPLTCCSSVGPSSLPATPSCWLSDERSPHRSQKNLNGGTSPTGAVTRHEQQQQDGSMFVWEAAPTSTPVKSSAAPASSCTTRPEDPSPQETAEEDDGCVGLLIPSPLGPTPTPYTCGRLGIPLYRDCILGGNESQLGVGRFHTGSELASSEQPAQPALASNDHATPPPVFCFSSGCSADSIAGSVAPITSAHTDSGWRGREHSHHGPFLEERREIVTKVHETKMSLSVLRSRGDQLCYSKEHTAEESINASDASDQCTTTQGLPAEGLRGDNKAVTRVDSCYGKDFPAAVAECQPACSTLVVGTGGVESSPSTRSSSGGLGVTAVASLPLQLPIPARVPRGKAHNNVQLGRQPQRSGPLLQHVSTGAEAVTKETFAATSDDVTTASLQRGGDHLTAPKESLLVEEQTWPENEVIKGETPRLPTLLQGSGNRELNKTEEGQRQEEGTSRCRLQLPACRISCIPQGEVQQHQQATALSAMERAAARAKRAARAAAACAAVIDAAAAAARNAAAASAANQGSAGTAAGDYTEYPDLQRNIHDHYNLFCNSAPEAVAFSQSAACSSSDAASGGGGVDPSKPFWQSLSEITTTEADYLQRQTCQQRGAEGYVGGTAYWPDRAGSSFRRYTSRDIGTSDSRSSSNSRSSTRCTDSQKSASYPATLGGDTIVLASRSSSNSRCSTRCTDNQKSASYVATLGRGTSVIASRGSSCSGIYDSLTQQPDAQQQQQGEDCMPPKNHASLDAESATQRSREDDCHRRFKAYDLDGEPSREGTDSEVSCSVWTTDASLRTSRNCFSRSSSTGTEASSHTLKRRGSRRAACWCCRSCSLTKCSSLASSPRSRGDYPSKSQWCCDSFVESNDSALVSTIGTPQDSPLPSARSFEDVVSVNVTEQEAPPFETEETVETIETQTEGKGRESTPVKRPSTDQDNARRRSTSEVDPSSESLPREENTDASFSAELLKRALDTSEKTAGELQATEKSSPLPSQVALHTTADDIATTAPESHGVATERSRKHVVLGAGRFGKVVLGHHKHSGLRVAVKIIDKSRVRASEEDEVNFRQEIEMHRRLPAHRNIVTVYDVYEDRKSVYLVMELCDRVTLLDKLAEEGPLREDVARQIFLQILAAVKHCHDHHVVHRDLKPENVLFARRQQPAGSGRLFAFEKPPNPAEVHPPCCGCQPATCRAVSPENVCVPPCCCCSWMPYGNNRCEEPTLEHAAPCRFSPTCNIGCVQTSECCCTKREAEQPQCWARCVAAVDTRTESPSRCLGSNETRHAEHVISSVRIDNGQPQRESDSQRKGHVESEISNPKTCGQKPEESESDNHTPWSQDEPHQGGQPEQTGSCGSQHILKDYQLQRESVLRRRSLAAQSEMAVPEAPPQDSKTIEQAHLPNNNDVSQQSTRCSSQCAALAGKPSRLVGVARRCCCQRCCVHNNAAEREMCSSHEFSLHMLEGRRDREEPPPTVKLIDFGAACSCAPGQLRGTACGTTHYLAPEVLIGNYYDGFASDAWSLGVILFTMLAAAPPFDGLTHSRLTRQIVRGEYRMDGLVWWNVSTDAKNLILRLLDVNPQTRITVNEAARHPWVMRGLPSGLPSMFFENAHCLSSLAAAACEATQSHGGYCSSYLENDEA